MGIRFLCPNGHKLNVKAFLAGKRGICPECDAKFLVPQNSGVQADSIEETADDAATSQVIKLDAPTQSAPAVPPAMPTAVGGEPTEQWYVRLPSGEQFGPAETDVMRGWVAEGRVAVESWVWRTGWPEWKSGGHAITLLNGPTPPTAPTAATSPPPAVPEVSVPPELPEVSTPATPNPDVPNPAATGPAAPNPTARYLSTKRSRQARARTLTFLLSGLVLLLFAVLVFVLMRNS